MHIRRERTHQCGLSNIDFKTKRDRDCFKEYKDDLRSTQVGTMGKTAYKIFTKPVDNTMSLKITNGSLLPQPPNAKLDSSINFYKKTGKDIKRPQLIHSQKDSILESNKFDGKPNIGEDVKVNEWYHHQTKLLNAADTESERNSQPHDDKDPLKQLLLKGDKQEKNEKAITETQLVKVKNNATLEGKVDIEKVKGIRRAIRRRYGNRTNFRKIFNVWDRTSKGYIDSNDAYNMVSKLGIKINEDEAAVLLASVDKNNSGFIGMDEFMSLIFGAEDTFNVNLSKIKKSNDNVIGDTKGLTDEMAVAAANLKKAEDYNEMRHLLKRKIGDMFGDVQYGKKRREMDISTFKEEILEKGGLPDRFKKEEYIEKLFNECEKKNNQVDFIRFLESIRNFTSKEKTDNDLGSPVRRRSISNNGINANTSSQRHLLTVGRSKIPINKLELLIERSKRFAHIVQNKYQNNEDLQKLIKSKHPEERINEGEAEEFFINELKPQLMRRELTRDDIRSFLFALPYDNLRNTNIQNIAINAYRYAYDKQRRGSKQEIL